MALSSPLKLCFGTPPRRRQPTVAAPTINQVADRPENTERIDVLGVDASGVDELAGLEPAEHVTRNSHRAKPLIFALLGILVAVGGITVFRMAGSPQAEEQQDSARPESNPDDPPALDTGDEFPDFEPDLATDGPIFPDAGDWSILARTSRGLVVIDLATGNQRVERSVLRHPILVTQDHLVYGQTQTGVLHSAPLDDLASAERMPGTLLATPSSIENRVWVISEESDLPTQIEFSLVDLDTLQIVRRVPSTVVRSSFSRLDAASLVSPEIATSPAGGAYELLEDGSYRRFSDGTLETHGFGLSLLERCDDFLQCEFFWAESQTGEELDRPVPRAGGGPFLLAGDGQWLINLGTGRTILNTTTGEEIDLGTRPTESISITPDGRYATYRRDGGTVLEVMDTDTAEVRQVKDLQLLSMASNGVFPPAVFVPTAALQP